MSLVHTYPGMQLKVTKRDVDAAFRILRLHPALALAMVTEFPANHIGLATDIVCFYLAIPFGWSGSPSHFAFFGDTITYAHLQCGVGSSATLMRHAFRSALYVDGGIFVELNIPERLSATAHCWEWLTRGMLGRAAINVDKLSEAGACESHRVLLGFVFNLDTVTITLPDAEIGDAKALFSTFLLTMGSQMVTLLDSQQLRGHIEHFQSTNEVWKLATGPTDALLTCSDELNVYIRCPDPRMW